jgi:DNA-binding MurR/RpiR family transcriptional regulator
MNAKSLLEKIQKLKTLTPSETKISDYFSRNFADLVFDNVGSISRKSGVSKATVVRFISKLGYGKFSDFHKELREDIQLTHDSLHIRYPLKKKLMGDAEEDILAEHFTLVTKNLQEIHHQVDQKVFNEIAKLIATVKGRFFITGQRTSYALAHLFYSMIRRVSSKATLIEPQGATLPDTLLDVDEYDMLFAIFRHPYAKQTFTIAHHFIEQKAPVILLTDSAFSPLGDQATHQIVVKTEGVSIFTSSAAIVAVLESLNVAALKYFDESISDRLEKTEKMYGKFDVFC